MKTFQELREWLLPQSLSEGVIKRLWHLTSDPHFVPNPNDRPKWNSLIGDAVEDRPAGLFVSDMPEYWMQAYNYERPYVAQVEGEVTNPPGTVMIKGREEFMQGKMRTIRVVTIDEYCRETFHEPGWVEKYFYDGPGRLRDILRPKLQGYVARTTKDMSAAELREWEQKFKKWTKRSR